MRRLNARGFPKGIPPRCLVVARSFSSTPGRPALNAARLGLSFVLGIGAGASITYVYTRRSVDGDTRTNNDDAVIVPATTTQREYVEHDALKYGWPLDVGSQIQSKSSYAHAFDGRTRNPRWVMEKLTPETLDGPGTRKKSEFYEDESTSWKHRARLDDFRGSGYDRGHLVAAANQKRTQDDMDATFSLANISPQVGPGFNRDYWAKLEQFVRDVAGNEKSRATYVATGPLFLPSRRDSFDTATSSVATKSQLRVQGGLPKPTEWEMKYPMLGEPPAMVAVPTHFFKVLLVEGTDSKVSCAAFVLPNAPIPKDVPLRRFVVPLTDLEVVSGLEFFKRGLAGEARVKYDRAERSFLAGTARELPGAGKIPSLPPANLAARADRHNAHGGGTNRTKWASVEHLCSHTSCELAKGKWDKMN